MLWIKGMRVVEDSFLYWTDTQIGIAQLNGSLVRRYKGLPMDEGMASEMLLLPRYQYIAIGLRNGYIHVCKYFTTLSVLYSSKAHLKPVQTLVQHPSCASMMLSGATDGYIRIWNIEVLGTCEPIAIETMRGLLSELGILNHHHQLLRRRSLLLRLQTNPPCNANFKIKNADGRADADSGALRFDEYAGDDHEEGDAK